MTLEPVGLLGVSVSVATTTPEAADFVIDLVRQRGGGYVCLCNVHVLMTARKEAGVRESLNSAAAVFADGAPLAWLQRWHGAPSAERVTGTELLESVVALGQAQRLRHLLFGASDDVLALVQESIQARCPDALVVGTIAPPLAAVDDLGDGWLAAINQLQPDVVWCALGAPKQELWMRRFASELEPAVLIGVGAAFDFIAGSKRRAPGWMQRVGLEWLHRLGSEPRRLLRRYAKTNTEFVVAVATDGLRRRAARRQ